MLANVTFNIQALSQAQFGLAVLVCAVLPGGGFILWKKSFQHARVMEDMPTSKVRSSAQGFVDLSGLQHPLAGNACTWWDYKIEKKKTSRNSNGGDSTTWVTVEKETSVGFFHLKRTAPERSW